MRQQRVQVREPAMFTISWMSKIFQDCYARTMLHNLQCKEYKHGTQKPRNSKTIPPLQIMDGCGNRLLFTLPFTHLRDHVPDSVTRTRMACRKISVPPWQRPKHRLSRSKTELQHTAAFKLVLAKLLLQCSFPSIQNRYFKSTKSPSDPAGTLTSLGRSTTTLPLSLLWVVE